MSNGSKLVDKFENNICYHFSWSLKSQTMRHQKVFVSILIFRTLSAVVSGFNFDPSTVILKNYTKCLENEKPPVQINQTFHKISTNKYVMNGQLDFQRVIHGPIQVLACFQSNSHSSIQTWFASFQLQITTKRCDYNKTKCEHFDTIFIPDVCKVFELEDKLWTDFMEHTQPKPKCPFNMKSIQITNATIDLGYIAHLPLDGFDWTFQMKTFNLPSKGRKKKQLLFCGMYEVIVKSSQYETGN